MELFAAAGVDLPTSGRSSRAVRSTVRSLRVPLFNYNVVKQARGKAAFSPTPEQTKCAIDYAKKLRNVKFLNQKETAVRPIFIQDVLQTLLGYRTIGSGEAHTLAFEAPIRTGAVDVALGHFGAETDRIVAPFELKGPMTEDLERIEAGQYLTVSKSDSTALAAGGIPMKSSIFLNLTTPMSTNGCGCFFQPVGCSAAKPSICSRKATAPTRQSRMIFTVSTDRCATG
jgi:hypothetical protein